MDVKTVALFLWDFFQQRDRGLNPSRLFILNTLANALSKKARLSEIKKLLFITHCQYAKITFCVTDTPSQRVQFLLGTEDDDEEHIPHDLFTELDEICLRDGEDAEWRETAR